MAIVCRGFGGRQPPVLISLILCLFEVKTKKSALETQMNGSLHQNHENPRTKSRYYEAIFSIFIGNPIIGIATDGDLS